MTAINNAPPVDGVNAPKAGTEADKNGNSAAQKAMEKTLATTIFTMVLQIVQGEIGKA